MITSIPLSADQLELERQADKFLRETDKDPDCPAYTEIQLANRGRKLVSIEHLDEIQAPGMQPFRDELRFLMSVTRMRPISRACLKLWVDNATQLQIAKAFHMSQQSVSYRLREALRLCYEQTPISFRNYSRHTIYHRPYKRPNNTLMRRCAWCGDPYPAGAGEGKFCSTICSITCENRGVKK